MISRKSQTVLQLPRNATLTTWIFSEGRSLGIIVFSFEDTVCNTQEPLWVSDARPLARENPADSDVLLDPRRKDFTCSVRGQTSSTGGSLSRARTPLGPCTCQRGRGLWIWGIYPLGWAFVAGCDSVILTAQSLRLYLETLQMKFVMKYTCLHIYVEHIYIYIYI